MLDDTEQGAKQIMKKECLMGPPTTTLPCYPPWYDCPFPCTADPFESRRGAEDLARYSRAWQPQLKVH